MSHRLVSTLLWAFFLLGCQPASRPATRQPIPFPLHMNYEGAEALLAVLEQRTVTDADIDKLFAIRGVEAMVDHTTRSIPSDTRDAFRAAVKEFVTTRKSTIGHFRLDESARRSTAIRALITKLKGDTNLVADVAGPISRYTPSLQHFIATGYGTSGGVSDGFVVDDDTQPDFYMAMERAEGDIEGVKLLMTHELYHVVQRVARARVPGLNAKVFDASTAPSPVRLLTAILEEGTATYVAKPLLGDDSFFRRSGRYLRMWRAGYKKNAPREKITANFAEVDRVLAGLRAASVSWKQASDVVFNGFAPGPYSVGYEMAKAIDSQHGPARIASLLDQHPAEFFRAYIEIYRKNPGAVPAKFSKETEAYIDSIPAR